ncbi:hypothetical protein [Streptomyces capitiformicae]|uniref:DNA primase n=1 Tax=Streptomyces capitiformicae TaxID=2014920 RepID=A0A919LC09_9ACTN|nr:hypothetical protein [Streptomyces capitiformicae]GHH88451.1 hypothetical protein GCM10017771_33830 [Streptomyces capitiformicae]
MNNATIGAAVLGGYLLGRTKKAKLALGVGALLAGSKVRPGQLGKALDSQFLSNVTHQVRTELTDASKAAASSVLTAKVDSLAGTLHDRAAELRERAQGEGEAEREEEAEQEGEAEREEEREPEREDEKESRQRSPRKKTAAGSRSKSDSSTRSRRQGQDDG